MLSLVSKLIMLSSLLLIVMIANESPERLSSIFIAAFCVTVSTTASILLPSLSTNWSFSGYFGTRRTFATRVKGATFITQGNFTFRVRGRAPLSKSTDKSLSSGTVSQLLRSPSASAFSSSVIVASSAKE